MGKYIPPHLRGVKSDVPKQETDNSAGLSNREKAELERHGDMMSHEYQSLRTFFLQSPAFKHWQDVRTEGYDNKYISQFFTRKNENSAPTSVAKTNKRKGAFRGADWRNIFSQFFKYAVDCDLGLGFVENFRQICERNQKPTWFLDFGFAPGGMSDLLLGCSPFARGVGVSLPPNDNGNVYLPELDSNPNFEIILDDVILLARNNVDIREKINQHREKEEQIDAFDMVVVGITIHQDWDKDNLNQLKDMLHFSQLMLGFKCLRKSGSVLMRLHMSLRLVDLHLMCLMLRNFKGAIKTTKPFSTFSMRKTYWAMFTDFEGVDFVSLESRFLRLIDENVFAYGWSETENKFELPILIEDSVDKILEVDGARITSILEPVWKKQVVALKGFMEGKKDVFCDKGWNCGNRRCNKAHTSSDMIPEVLKAIKAVDEAGRNRLAQIFSSS